MSAFGFGQERDRELTRLHFWLQISFPTAGSQLVEVIADGVTVVQRQAAVLVGGGRFAIDAEIIDMPHEGRHPLLGPFKINVDPDQPTLGRIEGTVDATTGQPRIDAAHPARGYFDVRFQMTTRFGVLVTGTDAAHVENEAVTELFPASPYTHVLKQALLQLFMKGQLSQPMAKVAAGFHYKVPPGSLGGGEDGAGCCECPPPNYHVEAHGQRGCFRLRDGVGTDEQLLFAAPIVGGGANSPGTGVLAYVTVTNRGPRAIALSWDGLPPSWVDPARTSPLPPGGSQTVVAKQALKIALLPSPTPNETFACGDYVISWCCPEGGCSGTASTAPGSPTPQPPPIPASPPTPPGPPTPPNPPTPPPAILPSGHVIPPYYKAGHDVAPLIDGVAMFARLQALLDAQQGGYVHIRLLSCEVGTLLKNKQFGQAVFDAASQRNVQVKILLWQPGSIETQVGEAWITAADGDNRDTKKAFTDPSDSRGWYHKNIHVQLVEHPDVTGARHTKTFIFSGDAVTVLVSGLNLEMAERDEPPHSNSAKYHDVAVELRGPSTVDIEQDFLRHWPPFDPAQGPGPAMTAGANYVYAAVTDLYPYYAPPPQPPPAGGYVPIPIPPARREIEQELKTRIAAAENFIYMENFSITAPSLLDALIAKLIDKKTRGESFQLILVVRSPKHPGAEVYDWLHFVTHVRLSFAVCDAFTWEDGAGHINNVPRAGTTQWELFLHGGWFEESRLFASDGHTSGTTYALIGAVRGFTNGITLYRLHSSGAGGGVGPGSSVYIHSKVAIFDDEFAAIGSANFNPRSMSEDDELTAFIAGPAVLAFRQKLWAEHFAGIGAPASAAQWPATAAAAKALATQGGLAPNTEYVFPIDTSEFRKSPPASVKSGWSLLFDDPRYH